MIPSPDFLMEDFDPKGAYIVDPFIANIIGTVLRWLLAVVATWLVAAGIIPPDAQATWIAGVVAVLVPLIWGVWQKFFAKRVLDAALKLPAGATSAEAHAEAKNGGT